jgi:hypothetical protein
MSGLGLGVFVDRENAETNAISRYLTRYEKYQYERNTNTREISTMGERSERRTPHPNPLPGVPGRGDRMHHESTATIDFGVNAACFSTIERQASHCHRVGRVRAGFRQISRNRRRSSPDDPCDRESNFWLSSPDAPSHPRIIANSWSQRFEKNGWRQIDAPLAGLNVSEGGVFVGLVAT